MLSEIYTCEMLEIAFLMSEKNGKVGNTSNRKVAERLTIFCLQQQKNSLDLSKQSTRSKLCTVEIKEFCV